MVRSINERERRVTIIKLRRYGERERETKIVNEIESYACRCLQSEVGALEGRSENANFKLSRGKGALREERLRTPVPRSSRGNFKCSPSIAT